MGQLTSMAILNILSLCNLNEKLNRTRITNITDLTIPFVHLWIKPSELGEFRQSKVAEIIHTMSTIQ